MVSGASFSLKQACLKVLGSGDDMMDAGWVCWIAVVMVVMVVVVLWGLRWAIIYMFGGP